MYNNQYTVDLHVTITHTIVYSKDGDFYPQQKKIIQEDTLQQKYSIQAQ